MRWRKTAMFATLMACAVPLCGRTSREAKPQGQLAAPQKATTAGANRGQQVWEQNCSRCHNPPEGFSSRISGTIAMHMRVRANLSAADEKALRHFLNP